jgi:penicillin-binding protein 1A
MPPDFRTTVRLRQLLRFKWTQFGRFPPKRCNLDGFNTNCLLSHVCSSVMRKPLIISAKLVLALLSVAGTGLLIFEGWLIWRYEYGIGLPDKGKLVAVSKTGPACSASDQRTYIALSEIPALVRQAVIASDEPDFYERLSANPFIERTLASLFNRPARPAMISQSVTRCLMSLSPDCCRGPSLDHVIGQFVLMGRVVTTLSRDRIFEIYLNESYFGRGAYGVGAAAKSYFGKPLDLLSIDEIAFIVALPKAPAFIGRRKDIAVERRNRIVERMLQSGFINEADAASAKERPLEFLEEPSDGPGLQKNL